MNARGRTAGAALLVVFVIVLGACGSAGSGISSSAGAQLQLRVAAIHASAAQGDRSAAETQLAQLRVDVVQFRAADQLNDAAAARILAAAESVQTKLALVAASTTTTAATTSTTTTTTEPPDDKGKDRGKGKGRNGEDD